MGDVLHNRSLGAVVAFGFASLLVMMAALIALAIREFNVAHEQRRELAQVLTVADAADRLSLAVARADGALRDYILTHSGAGPQAARAFREAARQAASELQREPPIDPMSQVLARQVVEAAAQWDRQAVAAEGFAARLRPDSAFTFQRQYLGSAVAAVYAGVEQLQERLAGRVIQIRRQLTRRGDRLTQSLVVGFGLAGVVGILLAVYFVRLVTEPVARLVALADAVRAGDYGMARRLGAPAPAGEPPAGGNEIASLTGTLVQMATTLEEREERLRSHAAQLAAANQVLESLQSLADARLSDLTPPMLLEQLLPRLAAGVGAGAGAVFLRSADAARLEIGATWNMPLNDWEEAPDATSSFAAAVGAAGRLVLVPDLRQAEEWQQPFLMRRPVGAFAALPLRLGQQVIGVAHVEFREPRTFGPPETHLLQVFGERVERAMERTRALEEMAAFQQQLERQVEQQQAQLLRAERWASIGLVGGSIAHELRNPLGVISNSIYFLRRRAEPSDPKLQRHLDIIQMEVKQATRIINNLVDFSSGIEPISTRLDLNELVRSALDAVSPPPEVTVELDLEERLPLVLADESQLLQVFEHLIRNALQAMEDRGRLRIHTHAVDNRVRVVVQDTGPGIPSEDQQRVFEPLVSSRTKGLGLGLTLSQKIVEAHGGALRLESEPDHGATLTVELTMTERAPSAATSLDADRLANAGAVHRPAS